MVYIRMVLFFVFWGVFLHVCVSASVHYYKICFVPGSYNYSDK